MKVSCYGEIEKLVEGYETISFDIFDTLIYRALVPLEEVQRLSADNILAHISEFEGDVERIIFQRNHVTNILKDSIQFNTQEPSLNQVFGRILGSNNNWGEKISSIISQCVEFEYFIDSNNLEAIEGSDALLQSLKNKGKRVIAISDMYFTETQVRKILEKLGLQKYIDNLYVSADVGKTKQTTDLFTHVVRDLNLEPSSVLHIGDNYTSDFINARKAGIQSVHFAKEPAKPLAHKEHADSSIQSLISEISIAFICRVFHKCKNEGINKVYFLTRDGAIFHLITDLLFERCEWFRQHYGGIKYQELELSRTTTAFMSLSRKKTFLEILNIFIWFKNSSINLGELIDFFDIDQDDISKDISTIVAQTITEKNVETISKNIEKSYPQLAELIISSAKSHARTTYDYLLEKEAIGSGQVAFVDLGYTSTSTRQIAYYLLKEAPENICRNTSINDFLLIEGPLRRSNFDLSGPVVNKYHEAYISFHQIPISLRGNYSWLECFYSDHTRGPLWSYIIDEDGLLRGEFQESSDRKPTGMRNIVELKVSEVKEEIIMLSWSNYYKDKLVGKLMNEIERPNQATLDFISELNQGVGVLGSAKSGIIKADIGVPDFFLGNYKKNLRNEVWYTGSIAASNKKYLYYVYVGLKRVLEKAKIYRHKYFHFRKKLVEVIRKR